MKQPIICEAISYNAGSTTAFMPVSQFAALFTTGTQCRCVIGVACTVRKLNVRLSTQPLSGSTLAFVVRKTNVATSLAVTFTDASALELNTGATEVSFAAEDDICIAITKTGSPGTPVFWVELEIETADGSSHVFVPTSGNLVGAGPERRGLLSDIFWTTDAVSDVQDPMPCAGTITANCARHSASSGGHSFQTTIYKNGVAQDGGGGTPDTRCTTPSGTTGQKAQTCSLTVAAGDLVHIEATRVSGSSGADITTSFVFVPTTAGESIIAGQSRTVVSNGTKLHQLMGNVSSWNVGQTIQEGGLTGFTIKKLYVRKPTSPSPGQYVITVLKGGSATAIAVTVTGAGVVSDTTDSATITDGDTFQLQNVASGTAVGGKLMWSAVLFIASAIEGSFAVGKDVDVNATRAIGIALDNSPHVHSEVGKLRLWGNLEVTGTTQIADPSSSQHAATKNYVDGVAANLGKRARVRAATTANITIATALNSGDSLDGVTLATGDLVLVKNQTTAAENGIYVVGVSPARFAEFDTYDEHPGSLFVVQEGTTNADTLWICTSNVGGTLDTTAINFTAFTGGGGAPTDAQYVTLATNGTLTNERVLTAGSGITIVDGGAGGNVTIAAASGTNNFIRKTTTQTYQSQTTYQDDNALTWAIGANETWAFLVVLFMDGSTAADFKVSMSVPSGATLVSGVHALVLGVTTASGDLYAFAGTGGDHQNIGAPGTTNSCMVIFSGTVLNGANAGSMTVQHAQQASVATNTNVYAGSWGNAWKSGAGGGTGDSTHTAAYGSRPAASNAGDLFLPSDGFVIERDTGSAWVPWGPLFPMTAPVDGDFAWVNQGGASVSTTKGGIYLTKTPTSSHDINLRKKTAPATPYTITAAFLAVRSGTSLFGLAFREAGTGELHTFGYGLTSDNLNSSKWTSPTAFSAHYTQQTMQSLLPMSAGLVWLRIADDGTNRKCFISADGQNWFEFHSVGRTDFLTADEVGFFIHTQATTNMIGITLLSWKQG